MSADPAPATGSRVWRVSDLNRRVRGLLDADLALADVWVEGEVSGPSYPPSGHCFFTLKDAHSQIRAVLFREELARATVRPEHGAQLVCHGRVRAYEPQGIYQLYVESVTPVGAGDLHAQYEALRGKLAAEGLFEESRKRPLPRWPRRIGVVTSPVGAVWDDICTVLRRRYPMVEIVLSPTAVQGGISAPAIIRALKRLYAVSDLDLVILARGGGSIEDLWGFNDEQVVRTVVASPFPVVVGVGHESDVTLADFAADRRAPTPSAAAEIAVPDGTQLPAILSRLAERSTAAMTARIEIGRRAARGEGRALVGLKPDLPAARQRAAELLDRSFRAVTADLERRHLAAAGLRDSVRALGPLATLDRGYAVARRADGNIVRDPSDVAPGDALEVVVARGTMDTRVTTVRPGAVKELLS